ncbi:MalY/PatB family protein [Streptomyces marispadix]|uniref:cysteine-S-conjugate beta-lyase n=1 Tax=Streptomyces marispadix TaxID=2922868 RepID=A0ABS9T248_9ACTN|nr:aminotransferase class I/II-fold pyridoxal phosphate-dependent enzyme [Streptomyces marispadix]MCH6162590.1 aminotransferase class I/II-fold pyridoxal phosphate-dependent enzyme [Streptomyces marispadix]
MKRTARPEGGPAAGHGGVPLRVPGFDDLDRSWLRSRPGVKWRRVEGGDLPAWVADMDFPIPPAVAGALQEAVAHGDLGYPDWTGGSPLREAFARRMASRYGWEASSSRVREQTDLIQCLQLILHLATSPGDAVAVQTPNYPPFLATLRTMQRPAVPVPMTDVPMTDVPTAGDGRGSRIDMAALADGVARHGCKVLLLVNPHNPTGTVLTRDELHEIAAVARRRDLLVVSDEIHSELTHEPHRFVPFASLSPDAAARTVTITSATKAFNLAGLRCTVTHYGPDRLLAVRDAQPPDLYGTVSNLGVTGTRAAWLHGDAWQKQLLTVLDRNRRRVHDVLRERLPALRHRLPEATYFTWIDARALRLAEDPVGFVRRHGGVLLDGGAPFGTGSEQYLRLNFATSADVLEGILDGVVNALATPPAG